MRGCYSFATITYHTLTLKQMSLLPEETIASTPVYKVLMEHASRVEHNLKESVTDLNRVREELLELKNNRSVWEADVLVS